VAIGGTWGPVETRNPWRPCTARWISGLISRHRRRIWRRTQRTVAAQLRKSRGESLHRHQGRRRLDPTSRGYNRQNVTAFVERSLKNLETDALTFATALSTHAGLYQPEVFGVLDDLVKAGKLQH